MSNYNKVVVTTSTYSVADMVEGTQPICDTKILEGSSWSFTQEELPATVYYRTISVEVPKMYTFAPDSHYTEMASGRILEEEYTSLFSKFGKEFDSPNGDLVQVDNGIIGKVLNMSIKGQTVKRFKPKIAWYDDSLEFVVFDNTNNKIGGVYVHNFSDKKVSILPCIIETGSEIVRVDVLPNTKIKLPSTQYVKYVYGYYSDGWTPTDTSYLTSDIVITEYENISSIIPFGLSSTQAIISNNGNSYPIYEPTIQGKTEVLRAPKGTQNWVEINADEARDTATYDYKLSSLEPSVDGLPVLGSTPSSEDYIDRVSGVRYGNTVSIELDGTEIFRVWNAGFRIDDFNKKFLSNSNSSSVGKIVSNEYSSQYPYYVIAQEQNTYDKTLGITTEYGKNYIFFVDKKCSTVEQFKAYLAQQKANGTPVTVRYELATPTQTQLTEEQLKAYDTHKQIIELSKVGDVKDEFILNEDGSGTWIKRTNRRALDKTYTIESVENIGKTTRFIISYWDGANGHKCLCDSFISNADYTSDYEHVYSSSGGLYVFLDNTKILSGGVREWLDKNTINVIYNLKAPQIIHIPKHLLPYIEIRKGY